MWAAAITAFAGFLHAPHWPLAELGVLAGLVLVLVQRLRTRSRLVGLPLAALLLCAWFLLSLARRAGPAEAREIAQLLGLFGAALLLFRMCQGAARVRVAQAIVWGWGLCVLWAWGQLLSGSPPPGIGGSLGARALFSVVIAATAPLALVMTARLLPRLQGVPTALFLVAGGFTILYLPGFVLLVAAALGTSVFCLHGQARRAVLAATCLLVLLVGGGLTPWSNRQHLVESVRLRGPDGKPRRWVLELRAALNAMQDRPLLGHGAGRYQATVSAGRYRGFLPEARENVVERGTQCGYLVVAVEHGVFAAVLVCYLFLAAAYRAIRSADAENPLARALGLALLLFAGGAVATHLLVQGAGVLVAACLGLASAAGQPQHAKGAATWVRWLPLQAGALAGLAAVAMAFGLLADSSGDEAPATGQQPTGRAIVIEAESAVSLPPLFRRRADPLASNGAALEARDSGPQHRSEAEAVRYPVRVKDGGTYRLWLRAWWRDGCGNSMAAAVGDSGLALVGNDGTYGVWHWVAGPVFRLAPGTCTLALVPREPGARVDQIALVADLDFYPTGLFSSAGRMRPAPSGAPDASAAQHWPRVTAQGSAPFRIGLGGAYCVGPEVFTLNLGLPYTRLQQNELFEAKALAAYDVVWVAGPQRRIPDVWQALYDYVLNGGTLLFEVPDRLRGYRPQPQDLLAPFQGFVRYPASRGLQVEAGDSRLFRGLNGRVPIERSVCYWDLRGSDPERRWEPHGRVLRYGRFVGPALLKKALGKGRIYLLPLPLGFISLRAQRDLDPVARSVLRDAVGDRYEPLYTDLAWSAPAAGAIHFADDFMRRSGEGRAWQRETGAFFLTGGRAHDPLAFALKATGGASAVTGNPGWRDYRVSASVLAEEGEAGVWLTTSGKRRLALTFDGQKHRLKLTARQNETERLLREAPTPEPNRGWRRLSLFRRHGDWQAWIDGQRLFSAPAHGETAAGRFGVIAPAGTCYFDDVRVSEVGALLPGRDCVMGEEGSPRTEAPFTSGLEPHTVYSPLWFLRPDPNGRHAVHAKLPTFGPADFWFDGERMGWIPPGPNGSLVGLPRGRRPQSHLAVRTPLWQDYTFGARLTDWTSTGAEWQQQPRWSCDPQWVFLGVQTVRPSVLWYRRPLQPPYALYVLAAPSAEGYPARREVPRGLNLVLAGNGRDLAGAFTIRVGAADAQGCVLQQGERQLAHNRAVGLPQGGHAMHHRWFELLVVVERQRIRFSFDGRRAFDARLAEPVPPGRVGFWTENNAVRVARAALSLAPE